MTPHLSVVIPAYNESARLGPYLAEIRSHLDSTFPDSHEVLVVDDGSADDTAALVERAGILWPRLHLIRHVANRGKGAAVRTGVLAASGRRILFADADGATPIAEQWRLGAALARGAAVAAASRYVPGPGVIRDRNLRREIASTVFRAVAHALVGVGVKDTQCGFKMFEADTARRLFSAGRETGYLFDIEILALARRYGLKVEEVAVNWSERPGSKVRFIRDSWRMFVGLWRLRRRLRHIPAMPSRVDERKAA